MEEVVERHSSNTGGNTLKDFRVEVLDEDNLWVISYKEVSLGAAYCNGVGPRLRVALVFGFCIEMTGAEYGLPTSNGGRLRPRLSTFIVVIGRRNNGGRLSRSTSFFFRSTG